MREKCILVLVMHFKTQNSEPRTQNSDFQYSVFFILCSVLCVLCSAVCHAEVLDRVVAIVDDEIILLSEVEDSYRKTLDSGIEIKKEDALNSLINRILLLKQAKRFTTEYSSAVQNTDRDNALIKEYIEKNLKSFIRIPPEEIDLFYKRNKEAFKGKDFYDVREEIEAYLIEEALNKRLLMHIEALRKEAYIKIQTDN